MKLRNLTIENFRSFDRFTLNHLGRVNLLVGENNSGKTTVLEAAFVLTTQRLWSLWNVLQRRGEVLPNQTGLSPPVPTSPLADVRHLFPRHTLREEGSFELSGQADAIPLKVSAQIKLAQMEVMALAGTGFQADLATLPMLGVSRLVLTAQSGPSSSAKPHTTEVALEGMSGLKLNSASRESIGGNRQPVNQVPFWVNFGSLDSRSIARLYNDVLLKPEEDLVLEAVRLISPEVERMAPVGTGTEDWPGIPASRDGMMVRLAGVNDRIPLGSMGDGVWRMLGLALAVVHSQNSILLIDEIDTGLHHSVMDKMWRFLNDCSKRFNVQIIATTHSRDCYQSLATICRENVVDQSEVTIQRIERGKSEAVAYSEAEIIAAANYDIEVR